MIQIRSCRLLFVLCLLFGQALNAETTMTAENRLSTAPCYLFAYFKGNGEDGLHLALSRNGYQWTALREDRPFLVPHVGNGIIRDPFILHGPDGVFHMVWTSGWSGRGFGIAHSKDLVEWTDQKFVPILDQLPGAINCWAPELVWNGARRHYLIYWSSTIPGRYPDTDSTGDAVGGGARYNHRIYCSATEDFETCTVPQLLYDGGFNVIDANIVRDGNRWVMFLKDETLLPQSAKNIRVAVSDLLEGPYGNLSAPITPAWCEGPSALRVGDTWIVYYDEYTRGRFGAVASRDLKHWTDVSASIRFPKGTRHGCAFVVAPEVAERLEHGRHGHTRTGTD